MVRARLQVSATQPGGGGGAFPGYFAHLDDAGHGAQGVSGGPADLPKYPEQAPRSATRHPVWVSDASQTASPPCSLTWSNPREYQRYSGNHGRNVESECHVDRRARTVGDRHLTGLPSSPQPRWGITAMHVGAIARNHQGSCGTGSRHEDDGGPDQRPDGGSLNLIARLDTVDGPAAELLAVVGDGVVGFADARQRPPDRLSTVVPASPVRNERDFGTLSELSERDRYPGSDTSGGVEAAPRAEMITYRHLLRPGTPTGEERRPAR